MEPETWIRRRLAPDVYAFAAFAWAVGITIAFSSGDGDLGLSHDPAWRRAVIAFCLLDFFVMIPLLYAWRSHKSGVWIGAREVCILGPFHTWRLPIADAARFEPGYQIIWFPSIHGQIEFPCPVLRNSRRAHIGVWALHRFRLKDELAQQEPACERLNEMLFAAKGFAGTA